MNEEQREVDQQLSQETPEPSEQATEARAPAEKLKRHERLLLAINTLAFIALVASVIYSARQVSEMTEQTRNNIKQTTRGQVIELDKMMIEKPGLRKYFYSGIEIKEDDSDYPQAEAMAEMILDVFDAAIEFVPVWSDPEQWDDWMIESFARSPLLCRYLEAKQRWYEPKLMILMKRGREKATRSNLKPQASE